MVPANCIVERRWYTVPPIGMLFRKNCCVKVKLYQCGVTKNDLTLYYNESTKVDGSARACDSSANSRQPFASSARVKSLCIRFR